MTFHRTMVTSVTTSVTTVNINTLRYFRFIWSILKISIWIQGKMDVLKSDDLVKVRGRRGVKSPQRGSCGQEGSCDTAFPSDLSPLTPA